MLFALLLYLSYSSPAKKIRSNSATMILIETPNDGYWSSFRIDRTGWSVSANSEHTTTGQGEGPVGHIIDGNINTIWHSRYNANDNTQGAHDERSSSTDPFQITVLVSFFYTSTQITIDLGKKTTFRGFSYTPRQKGNNGKIKLYEFYIAQTREELNTKIQNNEYLSKGYIDYDSSKTTLVIFDTPETCQFIAFLSLKHDSYGTCAEFNLYEDPPSPPTATPKPQKMAPKIELVDYKNEGFWSLYRLNRTGWQVSANNEEASNGAGQGPISHIIDDEISTIWHTKFSNKNGSHDDRFSPSDPYQITIDLGRRRMLSGFSYTPRSEGVNGKLNDFEFYVAVTKEELNLRIFNRDYDSKGNIDSSSYQTTLVIHNEPLMGRYVAFLASPGVGGYGTCAEFNLYDVPQATPMPTTTPTPRPTPMHIEVDYGQEEYWSSYRIDRKGWNVTANSEQVSNGNGEGPASNMIDGELDTIWHSMYISGGNGHDDRPGRSGPYRFTIDLGKETTFRGFSYTPRQSGTNGRFQRYEFYAAKTSEELEAKIESNDYLSKGNFKYNSAKTHLIIYDKPETGRYVALFSIDHDGHGTCAEFNLYSDPQATPMPTATLVPPPSVYQVTYGDEGYWSSFKIDRHEWIATANSEQVETNPGEGPIRYILDDDVTKIWHSKYINNGNGHDYRPSDTDPFNFTINLTKETTFRAFSYTPRQTGDIGKFGHYEFYAAMTNEELETKVQNKDFLSKGDIDKTTSKSTLVVYSLPVTAKFVALLSLNHDKRATCAEFNLYSEPSATPFPTPIPKKTTVTLVEYGKEGFWASYRLERYDWTVSANSEQAPNGKGEGPVSYIIDDDITSIWHTKHSNGQGSHDDRQSPFELYQITINLGKVTEFRGFSYTPRQAGDDNGNFEDYEFYVADTSEELQEKVQRNEYVSKGPIDNTTKLTTLIIYDEILSGRFIAIRSLPADTHGSCAEFNLYGVPLATPLPTSTPLPTPLATPTAVLVEYNNEGYWAPFKIDRSGWIVTANSEQGLKGKEGPVTHIIDGDATTFWHTKYNDISGSHDDRDFTSDPYQITINLGKETTFRAFSYTPRTDASFGKFSDYEFYVAQTQEELQTKVENNDYYAKGDIDKTSSLTTLVIFSQPTSGVFIALRSKPEDGHGSCAEFELYSNPSATPEKTPDPSPTEKVPDPTIINKIDLNSDGRVERIINESTSIMLTINVTIFSGIKHTQSGGAIYVENVGIECDGSVFDGCSSSDGGGGAIYANNTYDYLNIMSFENLEIKNCKAQYGGGMYVYSSSPKNTVTIRKCVFTNNEATALESSSENSQMCGGSCIFLMAYKGLVVRNKFANNIGSSSIKLCNDFDEKENENQHSILLFSSFYEEGDEKSVLIEDCEFEISKDESCSVFYNRGNKGASYKLNKCTFTGELRNGASFIDGRVISNKSPMLVISQCRFDADLENMKNMIQKNNNLMVMDINDQTFKKNESNEKKKKSSFFSLISFSTMSVVAATAGAALIFIAIFVKKYKNNENSDEIEIEQDIVDESLI